MWLFVYGTLLDVEKAARILKDKVKSAKVAFLPNYELVFNVESEFGTGNPNIREGGKGVWGVIYEVDEKDLEKLDKISPRYRRIKVKVITDGKEVEAWTYIGKKTSDNIPPDKSCVERVIKGARAHGLPKEYIEWLENLLKSL